MKAAEAHIADSRAMASAGALLFASGAVMSLLALILPHRPGPDPVTDIITSSLALVCAGVLWRFGRRARMWFFHVMVQTANALIAVGMLAGGPVESTEQYALLYLWGALYSFYFFTRRAALLHALGGTLGYGAVLFVKEPDLLWMSKWFVMMSSFIVAGLVVSFLTNRIRNLARHDPLTGLRNRRTYEEELEHEMGRTRGIPNLCVLLIDLDDFKEVNDSLGHQAGDRFLKEAAAAWIEQLRQGDSLARYGGDEFAAILRDCTREDAQLVAERLRVSIPDGRTCSIGLAMWDGLQGRDELLGRADQALYEAKRSGRNQVFQALSA